MCRFYYKIFTLVLLSGLLLTGCAIEPKKTVPKQFQIGQTSYHRVCAQCHGPDAIGGKRAPTFMQEKFIKKNFSNNRMTRTILNGSDSGAMPSQKRRLNEEEVGEIIKYIRHSQNEAGIIS